LKDALDMSLKLPGITAAKSTRALGQSISRSRSDRAGPPHHHVAYGNGRGFKIAHGDNAKCVRQEALLDQEDGILSFIEGNRPALPPSSIHRNVHSTRVGERRGKWK
jgi:hypothetical protein